MGTLPHQQGATAMQAARQLQGNREGARLFQQDIGLQPIRQDSRQVIQEGRRREPFQLTATGRRSAPHHLDISVSQGEDGERPFGPQQFPGFIGLAPAQLDLGREAALAIGQLPLTDGQGSAAGRAGAIGGHHQIGGLARVNTGLPCRVWAKLQQHRRMGP